MTDFEKYINNCVCGGWCTVRERFDDEKVKEIKDMLPQIRKEFIEWFGDVNDEYQLLTGTRFNDDSDTIVRMESANKEKTKNLSLRDFIIHALVDCANSDYYYMYEKDWGDSDEYEFDDDGGDDD